MRPSDDGFTPDPKSLRWVAASVMGAAELRDHDSVEHDVVMEQLAGGPVAVGCDQERERCRLVRTTMLARLDGAQTTASELPDLDGLRAMNAALDKEMDPVVRARGSIRIAYAAIAVAFTEGLIAQEVTQRLINALDGVLAELEGM